MEFGPPRVAPHVPESLRPWLEVDPVLRALVTTRLTGHPTTARAVLQVGDLVDVDARITAELEGRGIHVGGSYRKVAAATWSFAIDYWPWP
jgi:hypothetical protein